MSNSEIRGQHKAMILSCLRHGRDLANSRQWLSTRTGLNDRYVRELIEELRMDGFLICNAQNGWGYYLADDMDEVLDQYKQDMARAMSILRRMKPFRQALRTMEAENSGQVRIEDLLMDEFMVLEDEIDGGQD